MKPSRERRERDRGTEHGASISKRSGRKGARAERREQ